ncbi:unnamed protein product [Gadus morhua 'NCC']
MDTLRSSIGTSNRKTVWFPGPLKLADLGYIRKVLMNSIYVTDWAGTPVYMPPEVLLGETKYSMPLNELQQCRYLVRCRYLPPVQPPSEPTRGLTSSLLQS